jgi:hypothetical protein
MRTHARSRSSYGTKRMGQLVAMLMGDLRRRARDAIHGVGATKAHCLAVCLSESFNAFYSKRTKNFNLENFSAEVFFLFPFQFHQSRLGFTFILIHYRHAGYETGPWRRDCPGEQCALAGQHGGQVAAHACNARSSPGAVAIGKPGPELSCVRGRPHTEACRWLRRK